MRIKELFIAPQGKKVTEKVFGRVLLSSICSILLCMVCLAGTTWAWFAVSVENIGNEIQIATVTAQVSIKDRENKPVAKNPNNQYELKANTYKIEVGLRHDKADWKHPVYVLMSMAGSEKTDYYYFTFQLNGSESQQIELSCGDAVVLSFSVSWIEPVSATPVGNQTLVSVEIPTEPVTEPPTTAPPATEPPATEPPTTEPPTTEPPATEPPATEPPATEPPTTEPPATEPPATEPPATEPPATEPPATEPPATEPPATEPPATEPPATEPPATEPPATEPPATEPSATEPPATEPPATEPSAGM